MGMYDIGRGTGWQQNRSTVNVPSSSGGLGGILKNLLDLFTGGGGGQPGGRTQTNLPGGTSSISGLADWTSPQKASTRRTDSGIDYSPKAGYGVMDAYGKGSGVLAESLTGRSPGPIGGTTGSGGGGLWGGIKNLGKGVMDFFGSDFGQQVGKAGLGLGVSLLGDKLAPKVDPVPQSKFVSQMEEGNITPRTQIGQEAMTKAQGLLGQEWTGLPEDYKNSLLADFDRQFEDEEKLLRDEYKRLRPNADVENDSGFKRDVMDLRAKQQETKNNMLAKLEQDEWNQYQVRQRQDIQQAMQIDEQTFNEYASLANADLNRIMMQTGLDYGQAQQFKDIFGKIGGELASSGINSMFSGKGA